MSTELAKNGNAPNLAALIGQVGDGQIDRSKFKVVDQMVSLTEGQYISGKYEGPGPSIELKEPDENGEVKTMGTHRFSFANGTFLLGSRWQLDQRLPDLVGHELLIERGPDKALGVRRVAQFVISEAK
jgi:hypothetical protein